MTRFGLIKRLAAANPHLYARDIERIVDTVFGQIGSALARGDRVELRGFGAFSTRARGERLGRNPRTGSKVAVPRKVVPHFKAGKELRERLNLLDGPAGDPGSRGVTSVGRTNRLSPWKAKRRCCAVSQTSQYLTLSGKYAMSGASKTKGEPVMSKPRQCS